MTHINQILLVIIAILCMIAHTQYSYNCKLENDIFFAKKDVDFWHAECAHYKIHGKARPRNPRLISDMDNLDS